MPRSAASALAVPGAGPRLVGVDYGAKRVGIALADPLGLYAHPHDTLSPSEAVDRLRALRDGEGIARVVVGWPLTPDGEEGPATARVRPFLARLRKALPGVPIETYDERDSSARASAALVAGGARHVARRDRGRIDAAAAAVILQDYLDEQVKGDE
ncbi:MAG TPA: Holliday junction resolvase RuvX [Rhodothermales bacterium]|nr:Holliday junction resolvase RuvX [Rhodothermales bacterium]